MDASRHYTNDQNYHHHTNAQTDFIIMSTSIQLYDVYTV